MPCHGSAGSKDEEPSKAQKRDGAVLLLAVFVVATCGLAYELIIGTTGAYLAGDGVRQFSITIGVFLSAMGLGSFLSRSVTERALPIFISVEVVIGLVGGFCNIILYLVYAFLSGYEVVMYTLMGFIGTLIGLEIPLLVRLLSSYSPLRVNISNVLALDYLGSLFVAIAFPLVLLPNLGLMRSGLLFGILNVAVGIGNYLFFKKKAKTPLPKALLITAVVGLLFLVGAFVYADRILTIAESRQYDDEIILVKQTKYQRIVLTRWRDDLRLFLNGNLQFSSRDEYRYHEALVHPALATTPSRERVLVLGGGDGLALREILKYEDVRQVTLVDIDREMVELSRTNPHIKKLNKGSLSSRRVDFSYHDAFAFMKRNDKKYNVILVDLPDPSSENLAKLYTVQFYRYLARGLAADGALAVQATSPYYTPKAFWTIQKTLEAAGLNTTPLKVHVPSFGQWGILLASHHPLRWRRSKLEVKTRYLSQELYGTLFVFPRDLKPQAGSVSTLDNPTVVHSYLSDEAASFKKP